MWVREAAGVPMVWLADVRHTFDEFVSDSFENSIKPPLKWVTDEFANFVFSIPPAHHHQRGYMHMWEVITDDLFLCFSKFHGCWLFLSGIQSNGSASQLNLLKCENCSNCYSTIETIPCQQRYIFLPRLPSPAAFFFASQRVSQFNAHVDVC